MIPHGPVVFVCGWQASQMRIHAVRKRRKHANSTHTVGCKTDLSFDNCSFHRCYLQQLLHRCKQLTKRQSFLCKRPQLPLAGQDSGEALNPLSFSISSSVLSVTPTVQLNSTQREFTDAGETPPCPHLFIKIKYKTIRHILLVLIYLQFRLGRLWNQTLHLGASRTCLNAL